MFNFMKKATEKEEKDKRKRDKREKKDVKKRDRGSMSAEELLRLDEMRRSLKIRGRRKEKEKLPSGITADYSASFFAQLDRDVLDDAHNSVNSSSTVVGLTQSDSSEASLNSLSNSKNLPPLPPKPPKRGILKGPRLSTGPIASGVNEPTSPTSAVAMFQNGQDGHVDSNNVLVRNTLQNELIAYQNLPLQQQQRLNARDEMQMVFSEEETTTYQMRRSPQQMHQFGHGQQDSKLLHVMTSASPSADSLTDTTNSSFATPPFSLSPVGESQGFTRWRSSGSFEEQGVVELALPEIVPLELPEPRELVIQRQPPPRSDFGFSLRRAVVVERSANGGTLMRSVIFAEPGALVQNVNDTGLLPGDRLIEVNGINVDDKSREEIIDLIKGSAGSVVVKVQPVAELSELSRRSGTDGQKVELAPANIRGGTLRRSGSLRFHQNRAKSEEHLAQEQAWLASERVWLLHRGGFTPASRCGPADPDTGKLRIRLTNSGEELLVDEEDVEKANPPQFDRAEDLSQLRFLNESSVLHTLRQRYASNLIHTYAGESMIVINPIAPLAIYSEKVVQMFKGCKSEDMPPHVYAMAQSAYRGMLATRRDHSLVFLGRSGGGKTTNFKHALHYLVLAAGAVNKILTIEKLNAVFTLLEAFGNSRTHINTNATRFTQLFSLDFDQSGQIASASLQVLLLEKSRIGRRVNGDPSFHALYRLLAGAEGTLRKELHLTNLVAENNPFITPLQKHEDKQRAQVEFNRIVAAFRALGVTEAEERAIWFVVAGIYHLSCAGAVKAGTSSQGRWQFARVECAEKAATLFGTSVEELSRLVFSANNSGVGTPSTPRPGALRTPSPTDQSKDVSGLDALESLLVGLYSEVFHCVAALVNKSISSPVHTVSSLLLCDAPGFQNPATCGRQTGASFEDLCHNYLQERLQLLFHHTSLVAPKDRYVQEGIDIDHEDELEEGLGSPQGLVSLLDRGNSQSATMLRTSQSDLSSSRQIERKGLLWLLDEETVCPGGSDESFLDRLFSHYGDRDHQMLLRKAPGNNQFVLQHLQGTNPVLYTATGWIKATRENPLAKSAITILQESNRDEVSRLFVCARGAGVSGTLSGSMHGLEGSQSLRRASSIRRTFTAVKRKNVCLQVKFTVDGLIETLRRTRVKFIHCFLPQHNAGCTENKSLLSVKPSQSEDNLINIPLLRSQVRGSQILEAVRLHKVGFPKYMPLGEFRRRFALLSNDTATRPGSPVADERRAVEDMLLSVDVDPASYRVGQSQQIFFRAGALERLESQRDEKLTGHIILLQARCRGYLARRKLNTLKLQDLAVRCIQRNVRKLMSVREWPWWRLYVKVAPLLNVHRTEDQLKARTEELEVLRAKVDRLEQERNHLKHDNDRLEAKLSEMTADFAEEHSTSTLAAERIDAEQSERLRLERELQDVSETNKSLQQQAERLEMELLYARAADLNGLASDAEDAEADGGVYKQRYQHAMRELDFTKRKMAQQHEDDLEQLVGLKKQLEKKLADAYEEVEEQRQVVGQWKRRVQKLNGEMHDLRLLLEEQTARNNLLEKKQRKFDSETQNLMDDLRQEKAQRERLAREKEIAIAEKFTIEQNLSDARLEIELKEERLHTLSQELEELTFGGKTEEEVAQLKKAKHELEKKLKDQEEELDDLAGQVQLLEQAKLRLEMSIEQQRKEMRKEMQQRDEELEDVRGSAMKKVKALEAQLENEHEERTIVLREKHELERRLVALEDQDRTERAAEAETTQRLKRDLKRTRALLRDAQTMLERSKGDSTGKTALRHLKNQLEDAECARAVAVKAKQALEQDLSETQAALEEASRQRSEAEDRANAANRERAELLSQLEENEEELAEVLKKYRAAVQQVSAEQAQLQEAQVQIAALEAEKSSLKDQLSELSQRLESVEQLGDPTANSLATRRLEFRTKELESKLELEQTTRARLETQIARLKENVEKLQSETALLRTKEQSAQDAARRLQRSLREAREEAATASAREQEATRARRDLEKALEAAEAETKVVKDDLRLALQRIEDLQSAIQGELDLDCSEEATSDNSDSD
ncbi:unconventional myosin-XVIIIa isoform X1 [Nasonia vitripennis]|uniref:Unconventional myosin-XVIIIa n=1 Tax=Nasonia vitripennis TaxID=7425 RepID=A0A7M7H9C7_NASVI|nr:unconventional myosin-XVIIIa isoform X1 [Nasonia vitripennis]XP_032453645.1 unconventional myosin-XVIIIa isoform X1 [Nasonia vitripennis]